VDPERPEDFVDKVLRLKESPELLLQMGKNSRKLAETVFDKSILCDQFVKAVDRVEVKKRHKK
jgi:glycosyltransferase involved in cell wall biosynthesis